MQWRYPKFGLRTLLVAFFLVGLLCLQLRREWRDYNPDFVFEQNLARRIERIGGNVKWNRGAGFRRLFFSVDHSAEIYWIEFPPYNQILTWTPSERTEIMRDIRRLRHVLSLSFTGAEFTDADFENQPPLPSQLISLHFDDTNVTWAGLDAATQQNSRMEIISLSHSAKPLALTTDCLKRFPRLGNVDISQSRLTTTDIREIVSVPSLHALSIGMCELDDAQFEMVRDRNLKYLTLIGTKINGERIGPKMREDLKSRGTRTQFEFY